MLDVFIGWDPTEIRAYEVCKWSIIRRSSEPVHVQPLNQKALRFSGLYRRAPEAKTQIDSFDHKPFSTEFTFTRFLVPHLMQLEGWALFCDCDFLFLDDVAKLWALRDDQFAVMVVKHHHEPPEDLKMEGAVQTRYRRKNWSSLVLWNCSHEANRALTVDAVNTQPGSWLHAFQWLDDDQIGSLPEGWNWLEGHSKEMDKYAIHYTRGGPWFEHCQDVQHADLWITEEGTMQRQLARAG